MDGAPRYERDGCRFKSCREYHLLNTGMQTFKTFLHEATNDTVQTAIHAAAGHGAGITVGMIYTVAVIDYSQGGLITLNPPVSKSNEVPQLHIEHDWRYPKGLLGAHGVDANDFHRGQRFRVETIKLRNRMRATSKSDTSNWLITLKRV